MREIAARAMETAQYGGGFRQEWLSGDTGTGVTFTLSSGAGLGNVLLTLDVTLPSGRQVSESIDVRGLTQTWVASILDELGR